MTTPGTVAINADYTQATFTPDDPTQPAIQLSGFAQIGPVFTGDQVELLSDPGAQHRLKLIHSEIINNNAKIVGRLLLTDQQRFSANKRGIPRYQFRPVAANSLPTFLVASKQPRNIGDQYAIVSYNGWTKNPPRRAKLRDSASPSLERPPDPLRGSTRERSSRVWGSGGGKLV